MNKIARYSLLLALCTVSFLQAGLFDWFGSKPTYQLIADTSVHPVLTKTKVSVAELEEGFKEAPVKLADGSFGTFTPLSDGQFVLRWQKQGDPNKSYVTRVFNDRKAVDLLLPDKGQIAPPGKDKQPTFFVYYGSPTDKLFAALLPAQ